MPMCRLTSQMKPNIAQMIVEVNSRVGSATQGGRFIRTPTLVARVSSQVIRRVRCRTPIHNNAAVTIPVATETPMI